MSLIRTSVVKVVGALALVAVLPSAAFAQSADSNTSTPTTSVAPAPAPKAVQPPAPYRWSGVYFGGIVGTSWAQSDVTTSTIAPAGGYFNQGQANAINSEGAQTLRPSATTYGGEAGYDFQVARLVFGGVYDFSVMTMNDFKVSGTNYPNLASTFAITQTIETNWLMTARARVGWISGRRLLIYGTAGIAWMDLKYQAQFSDNLNGATESGDFDELVNGWIYGGGAEWRLTRNIAVKGEYLYSMFDDVSVTSTNLSTNSGNSPQNVFTHTASFNLNVARGSIRFIF